MDRECFEDMIQGEKEVWILVDAIESYDENCVAQMRFMAKTDNIKCANKFVIFYDVKAYDLKCIMIPYNKIIGIGL